MAVPEVTTSEVTVSVVATRKRGPLWACMHLVAQVEGIHGVRFDVVPASISTTHAPEEETQPTRIRQHETVDTVLLATTGQQHETVDFVLCACPAPYSRVPYPRTGQAHRVGKRDRHERDDQLQERDDGPMDSVEYSTLQYSTKPFLTSSHTTCDHSPPKCCLLLLT